MAYRHPCDDGHTAETVDAWVVCSRCKRPLYRIDNDPVLSITCPACGATSYHPDDVANGYCGRCHAFTSPRTG